jgi:peptidoglycan hydrolase CwlO-like protein
MDTTSSKLLRAVGALLVLLLPLIQLGNVAASQSQPPSQRDVEQAEERLEAVLDDFQAVQARLDEANSELAKVRTRTKRLNAEIRRIAGRVIDQEKAVIRVARRLYMSGSAGMLEGLLASQSIADLESGLTFLRSSGQAHSAELDRLIVDRKLLQERLDELDTERKRAAEIATRVGELADALEGEVERRRAEAVGLKQDRARYEARAARVQEAAQRIQDDARSVSEPPPAPSGPYNADWDAIAQCESGGNWHLDGEYDGGLQFHPDTWLAYGGGKFARYAWQASREQQIAVGEKVLAAQGPSAWPNCFKEA